MAAAVEIPPAPSIHSYASYGGKQLMATSVKGHSCPKCGTNLPGEKEGEVAQKRIKDLEAQVEMLKEKATAAGMFMPTLLLRF